VHHGTLGERSHFAVLSEHDAQRLRVLQRSTHQLRVLYAVAVVGEQVHAGRRQLAVGGELLAGTADGDAARRQHLAQPGLAALGANEVDHGHAVLCGVGVGHRDDGGEPSEGRCSASGLDGLRLFLARLAEVHVQVDEAGGDDALRGIEHGVADEPRPGAVAHCDDVPVLDGEVAGTLAVLVQQRAAGDDEAGHDASPFRSELFRSAPEPSRTVGDLVEDHRAGQLAGIGDHLHAAVHRPRVHHQCMWCHACRSCGCEAVHRRVLVERGQQRVVHPLALHAQQVEHVEVGQQRIEVVAHLDGPAVQ